MSIKLFSPCYNTLVLIPLRYQWVTQFIMSVCSGFPKPLKVTPIRNKHVILKNNNLKNCIVK